MLKLYSICSLRRGGGGGGGIELGRARLMSFDGVGVSL
jgi:hypothetical protein